MGSLYVVGTGIRVTGQLTVEASSALRGADDAFALTADPLALEYLRELNPGIRSLADCYRGGRSRDESYEAMIEQLLTPLASGRTVCAAFYGHPGVFVWPSHEALRRASQQGHIARMLPGISSEDALVADLGLDPGVSGLQSYEASDFLVYARHFDVRTPLVLWQVGVLGDGRREFTVNGRWLDALVRLLGRHYPDEHQLVVYEGASYPLDEPRIDRVSLGRLSHARLTQASTLYVPPIAAPALDLDHLRTLGIEAEELVEASFQRHRQASVG